ncbi:DUF998 domain-containing protein [Brevundimonas sp.]|uniref:DUF998 domain-containing protein n=1 Tax=Brevundimonas sp. TaxID=1871086 RepID=UPI0037BE8886
MTWTKIHILLLGAILLPILYFGVQLVLGPTFPGYDPMTDAASLLGSDRSPYAAVFNAVALICGAIGLAGAFGLFGAFREDRCPFALNLLILAAVLLAASGCIWAGVFPLPDPRHRTNPSTPALLALPLLFAVAAFAAPSLKRWRVYFVANLALMALMVLIMSGVVPVDRAAYGGLLQRFIALAAFSPISVAAVALWRTAA